MTILQEQIKLARAAFPAEGPTIPKWALVTETHCTDGKTKPHWGFRFDPTAKIKLGDVIDDGYGFVSTVRAVVSRTATFYDAATLQKQLLLEPKTPMEHAAERTDFAEEAELRDRISDLESRVRCAPNLETEADSFVEIIHWMADLMTADQMKEFFDKPEIQGLDSRADEWLAAQEKAQ